MQQAKDAEMIGNMNEIIGIKKDSEATKSGKTSIMTTSLGKTLKRKQDDDVAKLDSDEVTLTKPNQPEKKKVALVEALTITPITKTSAEMKEPQTPAGTA